MAISNFLNPEEEKDIQDGMEELGPEEVLSEVLEEHLGQGSTQDDDEEQEPLEQPSDANRRDFAIHREDRRRAGGRSMEMKVIISDYEEINDTPSNPL
ncbi:hypothetical protein VC83_05772 [Pseudogymnoascus destructans]|uniref:Uncharacterized protein n=1 Tax=Pseudogymnoascus destructans TaxID=655981 RepID=A0A177A777_9PEZI|nr:uncharacterized protein VC83_05772 [Pseudogymnoascus destructans]OAF56983.1 hypothetical protein VC83_05772 [Pseudogymnoascus destructans]